ncbi:MAG: hypothetical protein A2201_13555 [Alicyclobacillus sp. RIFOXYA1_FULL_53_8]|nr:MAG: hypothetical protein A2201_13555 [Alicyclobacillus sp. RIFOXYA1_FULL_53_8]
MRIEYTCKYCRHLVGALDRPEWGEQDAEYHLGFQRLNQVERNEAIAYNRNHDVVYVQTVCDYCQTAVESHPELLVEGKLLQ